MKARLTLLALTACLGSVTSSVFSQDWTPVAPGIDYRQYTLTAPDPAPNNVFVARMQRSNTDCIIDSSIGQGLLRTVARETVSGMANRYEDTINYWGGSWGQRSDVVVAINGSGFNWTDPGPAGGQIITGWQAWRFPEYSGSGFCWKLDRSCFLGGHVRNGNVGDYQRVFFAGGGYVAPTGVNKARDAGVANELIVYTTQYSTNTYTDSAGTEVLVEMTRPLVPLTVGGVDYVHGTIKEVRQNAGSTPIPFDHIVLSGKGTYAAILNTNCVVGEEIKFQFQIRDYGTTGQVPTGESDWTNAYASIGCFAYVVKNGIVPVDDWADNANLTLRNPRTAVAFNNDYVYFLVCDGRSAQSIGMNYPELGNFCVNYLGATWATNQDGGGSSAIWVNGQIKNVPSDGSERLVANGLFMVRVQPKVQTTTLVPAQLVTTNTSANVRLGPGTNYGVLTSVANGTQGIVVSHSLNGVQAKGYNWWKVNFSGTVGWVAESLLIGGGITPTITQQPAPQTVPVGGTANFTVAASGDAPLGYQWQKDTVNLSNGGHYSGVTTATLSVSPADINDVADYRCVVANTYGSITSDEAALTLSGQPTITQQPLPQNICAGGTAVFTVAASGEGTLTYQWQKNSVDLTDGGHYSGVTTTTLTVSNADAGDVANYRCVVTNAAGSTNSNQAPLTFNLVSGIVGMGGTDSTMSGVSTDGAVAAGNNSAGGFIWSRANGVVGLGAGKTTAGVATKSGVVVVGANVSSNAWRWDGTTAGVGTWTQLPLVSSTAWTILCTSASDSANNVWFGGNTNEAVGYKRACRYKQSSNSSTALETSGLPSYNPDSYVYGISDVGSYAGRYQYGARFPSGSRQAMGGSTLTALWPLIGAPSTSNEGMANTISRDGTKAGGWSKSASSTRQATIWTITNPTVPFGVPLIGTDDYAEIQALNSNGTIAAGYARRIATPSTDKHAIIWDATNGTRDLQTWLTSEYGLDLTGWALQEVKGMSGDGTVLAGNGLHNGVAEAWVVLLNVTAQAPSITQHPAGHNVCPGANVSFSVAAEGIGTVSYQWQKDEADLTEGGHYAGVTTATLEVSDVDAADAGSYRCIATIGCNGTTSNPASLTVKAATTITGQPAGQNVCAGATVQFSVTASGEGSLSYQWRKDGDDIIDGGDYSGATSAILTIVNADASKQAGYDCVVTAACGNVTSNPATLSLRTATSITQQPAPVQAAAGSNVQFTVAADGDGTISYQWQKNGGDLTDDGHYSGVTSDTLSISNVGAGDEADYRCVVTAGCGGATSNAAALTLTGVAADFDGDSDVDLTDFSLFQGCFNGPNREPKGSCTAPDADLDNDTDVDLTDFSLFQGCFNGPNREPKATCGT